MRNIFAMTIATLAVSLAVGLGVGTQRAEADLFFYSYTRSSPTGVDKDPINVLYTYSGTLSTTMTHFLHHVGWSDTGGSDQYFGDHGVWELQQDQRASSCGICERDHTRFNQQNDSGPSGYGIFTMGPAHYEQVRWCGHVSVSFNDARARILSAMNNGGHAFDAIYWGNTNSSQQCDGTWTAGDGYIVRIVVP